MPPLPRMGAEDALMRRQMSRLQAADMIRQGNNPANATNKNRMTSGQPLVKKAKNKAADVRPKKAKALKRTPLS